MPSASGWPLPGAVGRTPSRRAPTCAARVPRLTLEQLRLLPEFLWHGPEAYGLPGQHWTSKRIAAIIREEFGVSYSASQVSRLLKQLGWNPRTSVTRAIHRDEAAIERWRLESWPALKRDGPAREPDHRLRG